MSTKPHARRTTRSAIALYLAVALGASAAFVAAAAPAGASSVTVTINPLVLYASTGVTVSPGDTVTISASGTVSVGNSDPNFQGLSPAGNLHENTAANGNGCLPDYPGANGFPLGSRPCWSLIGNIGGGAPFYVGTNTSFTASTGGVLFLGINDNNLPDNSGSWTATVTTTTPVTGLTITGASPAPVTATSRSGAVVTYGPITASDSAGNVTAITCVGGASGSLFPIGTTTVTCTATDSRANPSSASLTLHIVVNEPGLAITDVPDITIPAQNQFGAYVPAKLFPTATDNFDPATVTCVPAQSTFFPPGKTPVSCSASDSADTPSKVTTTLTVNVTQSVPDAPTNVVATGGPESVKVSFDPVSGTGVTYSARCSSTDPQATRSSASVSGSPITLTGLVDGESYTCAVTATNSSGPGQPGVSNSFTPGSTDECSLGQTCKLIETNPSTPTNPSFSVLIKALATSTTGSITVSNAPDLHCSGSPVIVTKSTSVDSTGVGTLSGTVTVYGAFSGAPGICYSSPKAFQSITNPDFPGKPGTAQLLLCSGAVSAPCQSGPAQPVTGGFTISLSIPAGDPAFSIVVPKGRLLWPSNFPKGKVGATYSQHMQSKGGKAPFKWKVASGKLAPGLSLGASTGAVTGKPTTKGTFKCVVTVSDSESPPKSANISVSITIT
jgi:large repetitive protein